MAALARGGRRETERCSVAVWGGRGGGARWKTKKTSDGVHVSMDLRASAMWELAKRNARRESEISKVLQCMFFLGTRGIHCYLFLFTFHFSHR